MPTQNMSLTAPSDYGSEMMAIERRRKLAELMQQQSMQPIEAPASVPGGWAVPVSPLSGLAKMLQGYAGAKGQTDALSRQQALASKLRGDRASDYSAIMGSMKGSPATPEQFTGEAGTMDELYKPAQAATPTGQINPAIIAQLRTPEAQAAAMQMFQKQNEPFTLAADAKRFGPGGAVMATNPKPIIPKEHVIGGKVYSSTPEGLQNLGGPGVPVDYNKAFKDDGTPNKEFQDYQKSLRVLGAPRTSVSIDNKAEGAYASGVSGKAVDRDAKQYDAAIAAVDNASKLDSVLNHLNTSDAITGLGSDLLKNIERTKVLLAQSKAAGKAVSDTEYLDALLGSDVFPMIQQLGIGARGMDTPAEREYLRSVMTGTTSMNKQTLIKMTEIRRNIAQRAMNRWNDRVKSGEVDDFFKYSKLPKKTVDYEPPEVPQQKSGGLTPAEQQELQQLRQRYGNGRR